MLKTLIVEDDFDNLAVLKRILSSSFPKISIIGEADSVHKAKDIISNSDIQPDIVFLDIELPDGTAFDLLEKVFPVGFEVIFTTAHNEYLLKALRFSAVDYLLKPIDSEELKIAVTRAEEKIKNKTIDSRLENLLQNLKTKNRVSKIALPTNTGYDFVSINEILYCEAVNNCTVVHQQTGRKYTCTRTVKEYQELLSEDSFFRVHHSFIINTNLVKRYYKEGRGGYVEMNDGTTIEVASRRKDEFLSKFGYK
jgi:two-component system LytT family response regulator